MDVKIVHKNPSREALLDLAVKRHEGELSQHGALLVKTGKFTGRAANDKYFVKDKITENTIWWHDANKSMDPSHFTKLKTDVIRYLNSKETVSFEGSVGASLKYGMDVDVISESAWSMLFAQNMFIRRRAKKAFDHYTVLHAPKFHADPATHGTKTSTFIVINFTEKLVLIGGTEYGGEIKKSIFTIMNFLMPDKNVFPMHASANMGREKKDVAIFFGLSGTGKTTLSTEEHRPLIGDDEHAWGEGEVFNFEGGCYAKVIRLSREAEPIIYEMTEHKATVLENVVYDSKTKKIDLNDASITENTRACYPLDFIKNKVPEGYAGEPTNIFMLTCDAFGVLPPISKLSASQACEYFIQGYTAQVAGTEMGVKEPKAVFSACFGKPFMPRHPNVYGRMLQKKLEEKPTINVWLVNTGWIGGPYGEGERISIKHTRALINAALDGSLAKVPFETFAPFNLFIPTSLPGVPSNILNPKKTWKDAQKYDEKAKDLIQRFKANMESLKT